MKINFPQCIMIISLLWTMVSCQPPQKNADVSKHDGRNADGKEELRSTNDTSRYESIVASLDSNFDTREIMKLENIANLSTQKTTIVPELMDQFCEHVYKLPLNSDFKSELNYFCDEKNKPKQLFYDLDRYAKISRENPIAVEIAHKIEGEYSTSVVAVAYEIPIPPKFVKEASIPYYMLAPAKFPYFNQSGRVLNRYDGKIGGDLQFNKFDLSYDTVNQTSDGKTFANHKKTQFNGYQVQGGNSDIGLGAEHLVDENPDYKYFKTITITIGTETGGSLMINFANVTVKHNGYEKNARSSAVDIGSAQGSHVKEGILKELPERIIK